MWWCCLSLLHCSGGKDGNRAMCLERLRLRFVLTTWSGVWFICALPSCVILPAFGQEATIVGTITDPSGSLLPKATITATNIETGRIHSVTTNTGGVYVIPGLPVGHFSLKAEAAGFKTAEQNGIVLNVGDRVRFDFRMQLGLVKEAVTVEAASAKIQTETGEVSSVVTGPQVTQLATNGRSIYTLATLTPGSSNDQADFNTPTAVGGDNNVSFSGLRVAHNLYRLDGSETYDRGGGGGTDVMPSLDAIAEFRMLTSNYSAEYGLSSAATMSAVLRSGTKRFHATAWEFLRNDALDARNYFNRAPGPVAELRFNTFGFNVGGPVPFKDKDNPRTFFFYNMEWRRLIQGQTLNMRVPPASQYSDAGGTGTGAVFPVPIRFQPALPAWERTVLVVYRPLESWQGSYFQTIRFRHA